MRQTATQISNAVISQLEAQFNQTIPLLPKSFNRVLAKIIGLMFVGLFQYGNFIFAQMFVKTASDQPFTVGGIVTTPLTEWGLLIGLPQLLGDRFEGDVLVDTITQGGVLASGSQIVDTTTEQLFLTIGDVALTGPTVTATIRAVESGALANVEAGAVLAFVSPPAEVKKSVTVDSVATLGSDDETTEDYRARQLAWWSARPQGGAYADYREWGLEVADVQSIYPFSGGTSAIPSSGAGQVDIYVESKTATDGIANSTLLGLVYDNIEQTASTGLADRRPINAYVNTASIYRTTFDVEIAGLKAPDESATMTNVEEALTSYFLQRENYILGLSVLPRKDIITSTEAGGVVGRVVASDGGTVSSVTIFISGTDYTTYPLSEGEKAKLGSITWS